LGGLPMNCDICNIQPELDSEPWHVNVFNADVVPNAVLAWKKAKSLQ